jgi:hypothetical protein
MSKSSAFPEVSAAAHAFEAGWASALDYTNQPYPSAEVFAQAYARYVASVLMFSETETEEQP